MLYDNPLNFHRSVHVTNRNGSMSLRAGDLVPRSQLPAPLVLCLSPGQTAVFAVHGWENDDAADDPYALDFDNFADRHNPQVPNEDDVLVGFKRRLDDRFPTGPQVERSRYLEVRYRVSRKICDQDLDVQ